MCYTPCVPTDDKEQKTLNLLSAELRTGFPGYSVARLHQDVDGHDGKAGMRTFEVKSGQRRYLFTFTDEFLADTNSTDAVHDTLEALRAETSGYTHAHVIVTLGGAFHFESWEPR